MKSKPIILSENTHTISDLVKLRNSHKIWNEYDFFEEQLRELFFILNPAAKYKEHDSDFRNFIRKRKSEREIIGSWVFMPWNGILTHILGEEDFNIVRTNRNKNIITADEQKKLYNFNVAFAGLSIGNSMALNLVYSGIGKNIKIADFDILELSNLNRIRSNLTQLGLRKTEITAQQIYEINPYENIQDFFGIKQENLSDFISGNIKPNLIFEAIDDFEFKIKIRLEAKSAKVPVIMLTNLGDRLLIDVERYDLDTSVDIFNGMIGNVAEEILSKSITEEDKQKYAIAIVGKNNIPARVLESVKEVGKTLVGRPQIMSTVTIASGVASYLARRIVLGPTLKSGRYLLDFESLIQ